MARLSDGTFYYTDVHGEDTWHKIESLVMAGDVDAVNYNYKSNDVLLLSSAFDGLYLIKDNMALVCDKAPKFTSVAVHNERVFGTVSGVNNQVWFSDDFDPANWNVSLTEAGYINFADDLGQAIKAVSFQGYLFVFREYGIMRLTAYGDQSDFVLKRCLPIRDVYIKIRLCCVATQSSFLPKTVCTPSTAMKQRVSAKNSRKFRARTKRAAVILTATIFVLLAQRRERKSCRRTCEI